MESPTKLGTRFWRLWWANAINSLGDGVLVAAMPLLAVTVTRDPVQISLISVAAYLPWLLMSLPAGVYVDRHDRATLMWLCQAFQALIVAAIALTTSLHIVSIPWLMLASFLLGCAQVVITNAAQAVLPQLVSAASLQQANSNQYMVQTIGQSSAGPPLGSVMFAAAAALPFGVDAVSFVVSVAPNGIVLAVLIAWCGLAITVSSVVTVSLRQQLTPNDMFGRVNSVFRMVGWGLMPLWAVWPAASSRRHSVCGHRSS